MVVWQLPLLTLGGKESIYSLLEHTKDCYRENYCQHLKAILAWPKCIYFYFKKSLCNGIIIICTFRIWKCCWLFQGFGNILSECSFCIISIFVISINCRRKKKSKNMRLFQFCMLFLLLKHSVIHKLLSPCWNFHFCGSKQTPFKGGGTLSPVSATEVVTHLLFLLFNLANIKIRFFLVWDFSLDSSCRLSSWMFAAE